jgi:DNA-binding MarR family transcriptional regulator
VKNDENTAPPAGVTLARLPLAATAARRHVERVVGDYDLSWHEFEVLRLLRAGPARSYWVAYTLGLVRGTARGLVFGLAARGLVSRTYQTSRDVRLALTDAGHELMNDLEPTVEALEESLLDALTPAQRSILNETLRALVDHLHGGIDGDHERSAAPAAAVVPVTPPVDPAVAEMVAQYAAGASLREIAVPRGVAINTVRNRLLKAGVTLRPPGMPPAAGQSPPVVGRRRSVSRRREVAGDVIAMYRDERMGMLRIAAKAGLAYSTVRAILLEAGVEIRAARRPARL